MNKPLTKAEEALSRGDYGQCIQILENLINYQDINVDNDSNIRMILITAYIGKGENNKAMEMCRTLTKSKDKSIREEAKLLLPILEAPSLNRPSNWSVKIPTLNNSSKSSATFLTQLKPSSRKKSKVYHPPTGETKNPDFGFLAVVIIVLSLLTFLL